MPPAVILVSLLTAVPLLDVRFSRVPNRGKVVQRNAERSAVQTRHEKLQESIYFAADCHPPGEGDFCSDSSELYARAEQDKAEANP